MDRQAEKERLIKQLKQVEDDELIRAVQAMLDYALNKGKGEEHISIEQYNRELEEDEARMDQGEYESQEAIERRSMEW